MGVGDCNLLHKGGRPHLSFLCFGLVSVSVFLVGGVWFCYISFMYLLVSCYCSEGIMNGIVI